MSVQNELDIFVSVNWKLTEQDINLNCTRLQMNDRKTTIWKNFYHIDSL